MTSTPGSNPIKASTPREIRDRAIANGADPATWFLPYRVTRDDDAPSVVVGEWDIRPADPAG